MTQNTPETPATPAHLVWIWVLVTPQTEDGESLLAVEIEDRDRKPRRTLPVFETKEQAMALRKWLCPDQPKSYGAQAMLLSEASNFAAEHQLEILLLDDAGTILAHPEGSEP